MRLIVAKSGGEFVSNTKDFFKEKKEWSKIKDELLDWYLIPYLAKILTNNRPLYIIDCFAGKGKFADGSFGSPLIIAEKIKSEIINVGRPIKGIFIEKKYGNELECNIVGYQNCEVIKGSYENEFEDRLNKISNETNIFCYIDPYGIKSLDFNKFMMLKKRNFKSLEILMNFNSFGFLREGCNVLKYKYTINDNSIGNDEEIPYELEEKSSEKNLTNIAHGDYWKEILDHYNTGVCSMYEAEEKLVQQYVLELKKIFIYVINIPIKLKTKNIPKYRLIFGSNHYAGFFLMLNKMNSKWKEILDNQRKGQIVLFEYDTPDRSIYGDFDANKTDFIDIKIMEILGAEKDWLCLQDLIYILVQQYGIAFSVKEYNERLKFMEDNDCINIERNPSYTLKGNPTRFLELKTNQTVKVRLST